MPAALLCVTDHLKRPSFLLRQCPAYVVILSPAQRGVLRDVNWASYLIANRSSPYHARERKSVCFQAKPFQLVSPVLPQVACVALRLAPQFSDESAPGCGLREIGPMDWELAFENTCHSWIDPVTSARC